MKTLTLNGKTYHCPLTDKYRRHNADECERMDQSGAIEYPILIYRDRTLKLDNCIVDGEGRLETAIRAGSHVLFRHLGDMTTEEAYERSKALNAARRHDDPEAIRKRRERVAEMRADGESLRTIAKKEGVSHETIRKDLDPTVNPLTVETPAVITGEDGKKRKPPQKHKPIEEEVDTSMEFPFGANAPDVEPIGESRTTATPSAKPTKTPSKPPKNGRVKFDWKKFDEDFGRLRRSIDDIATAHSDKHAREYAAALQQLEQLRQTWCAWQARLTHGEAAA